MESSASKNKETKNFVVFLSDKLGSIYVPKAEYEAMGSPENVRITLEPDE